MFITQAPKENTSNIGQFIFFFKHFGNSGTHKIWDFLISPPLCLLYEKREQVPEMSAHSLELHPVMDIQDGYTALTKGLFCNFQVTSK